MAKERISVAFANQPPTQLDVEEVSKWVPKKVNRVSGHVFFNVDGKYVSMATKDYDKIFK